MNDGHNFELLAERGTRVGAERLADRIEAQLTGRLTLAGDSPVERRSSLAVRLIAGAAVLAGMVAVAVAWRLTAPDELVMPGPGGEIGAPVTVIYERSEYTQFMNFSSCPVGEPIVSGTFDTMTIEAWFDPAGNRFLQLTTYPDGSTREVVTTGMREGPYETFESDPPATRRVECVTGRASQFTLFRDPTIGIFPDMVNGRDVDPTVMDARDATARPGDHTDSVGRDANLLTVERPIHPGGGLNISWFRDPTTDEVLEMVFRETWPGVVDAGWTRTVSSYEEIVIDESVFSVDDMTLVYSTEIRPESLLAEPLNDGPALGSEDFTVWPPTAGGYPSGRDVAQAFAIDILGWNVDAIDSVDAMTHTIRAGESRLTVTTDSGVNGHAILAVGDTLSLSGAGQGQTHRHVLVYPIGTSAEIGVSTSDGITRWWRVTLSAEPPASAYVDLPGLGDAEVRAILVLWRDTEGRVITADAGWFGD